MGRTGRRQLASGRNPNWAFMERFEVPDYDQPQHNYLTRWRVIQTPWFGVYVHRMDGPDPRSTLHDHPWSFLSLILRGGYTEHYAPGLDADTGKVGWMRSWGRGTLHRLRAEDAHAILQLLRFPTWTLLVVGRRRRTWGYWDEHGWTPFDQHRHAAEFDAALAARKIGMDESEACVDAQPNGGGS